MNIIVLGAGTFGTAIANELSVNTANNVILFSRNQLKVDEILEKISRSGESSLTNDERETLTRASRRFKGRSQ